MKSKSYYPGIDLLVALVQSKMEPENEQKQKFIDYAPEPRKKRLWKRKRIEQTEYPIIDLPIKL